MSAIKSKDSAMEKGLRKKLNKLGLRHSKNVARLPGKPDVAFISKKVAVFLDSCFWHGCRYHCRIPNTNVKYWKEKIVRNKKRDKEIREKYKKMGWTILRFWSHQIEKDPQKSIKRIEKVLKNKSPKSPKYGKKL